MQNAPRYDVRNFAHTAGIQGGDGGKGIGRSEQRLMDATLEMIRALVALDKLNLEAIDNSINESTRRRMESGEDDRQPYNYVDPDPDEEDEE